MGAFVQIACLNWSLSLLIADGFGNVVLRRPRGVRRLIPFYIARGKGFEEKRQGVSNGKRTVKGRTWGKGGPRYLLEAKTLLPRRNKIVNLDREGREVDVWTECGLLKKRKP